MGGKRPGDWVHCGRVFSAGDIADIRQTVAWLPRLGRRELAATLCEHLQWYTVTGTGTAKVHACRELLERLEAAGLVVLPPLQVARRPHPVPPAPVVEAPAPIHGPLAALGPVRLEPVRSDAAAVAQWNAAVARWHPLGYKGAFSYRLRYFITAGEQRLGCLLLADAARALAVRDRWIGWDVQARRDHRVRVLNNSRFLIFPHVQVPHLASYVLGQLARRVRTDWLAHWGFAPLLLEAFVDPRHYAGTCYSAAGWELLGETSGSGLARPGQTYHSSPRQSPRAPTPPAVSQRQGYASGLPAAAPRSTRPAIRLYCGWESTIRGGRYVHTRPSARATAGHARRRGPHQADLRLLRVSVPDPAVQRAG